MVTDLQSDASESTANLGVGLDAAMPPIDDGKLLTEFHALTTGCGVSRLADRVKILLTGEDRTRWLNGMVTNNIRDLAIGQGLYAFLLNPQGKIQGDLYAFNRGADIALDLDRQQLAKLLAVFDHYIIMDDVAVVDASAGLTAIGVQGPKSHEVLQAAGIEVAPLRPLELIEETWSGCAITLLRAESWKRNAYEIWVSPEKAQSLVDALTRSGALSVGMDAQRLYRIASGIPVYGEDIRERDLPHETGQERALHYAKGCYVGQEIVERVRTQGRVHRMFSGFALTEVCPAGSKIMADIPEKGVKEVGEITSIALVPGSEHRIIALGYIRREALERSLDVNSTFLKTHPLPFEEILQGQFDIAQP